MFPVALVILGGLICLLNLYLSFLRYPLLRMRGRASDQIHHVSGVPLIGSLFVALSLLGGNSNPLWLWGGVAVIIMDTGGIHWFIGVMIWNQCRRKEPDPD